MEVPQGRPSNLTCAEVARTSQADKHAYKPQRPQTLRRLSQKTLGSQIGFSRVYISLVETAQERPAQPFVQRCDHTLETGGHLLAIYEHVTAEQAGAHLDVPALRAQAQDQHGALEWNDDTPVRAVTAEMPWAGGSDGVPVLDAFGGTTTAVPPGPGAPILPTVAIADVA